MKFYDAPRPLHLETDASGVGFRAILFQVRNGMNYGHDKVHNNATPPPYCFGSKSLSNAEQYYSNIE